MTNEPESDLSSTFITTLLHVFCTLKLSVVFVLLLCVTVVQITMQWDKTIYQAGFSGPLDSSSAPELFKGEL